MTNDEDEITSYPLYNANSNDVRQINEKLDRIIALLEAAK